MEILVNGEVKELSIIDAKSGMDWTSDMLGNHDACGYDDEQEMHTMDVDDFEWWAELLPKYEQADQAVEEYRHTLDDDGEFLERLNHATGCDLEDMPAAMMGAIEWHKSLKK